MLRGIFFCRVSPLVGDIGLAVVQDSSITVDFAFVGWTSTVAAAAEQGNSQRIPIMDFGESSVVVRMRVELSPRIVPETKGRSHESCHQNPLKVHVVYQLCTLERTTLDY
jgi:hypothetical protein